MLSFEDFVLCIYCKHKSLSYVIWKYFFPLYNLSFHSLKIALRWKDIHLNSVVGSVTQVMLSDTWVHQNISEKWEKVITNIFLLLILKSSYRNNFTIFTMSVLSGGAHCQSYPLHFTNILLTEEYSFNFFFLEI